MDPEILKRLMAMLGQLPQDATVVPPREAVPTPLGQSFPEGSVAPSGPSGGSVGEQPPIALSVSPAFGAPGRGPVKGIKDLKRLLRQLGMARNTRAPMTGNLRRDIQASKVAADVEPNIDKMLDLIDEVPGSLAHTEARVRFDDFVKLQENLSQGFGKAGGILRSVPELSKEMIAALTKSKMFQKLMGSTPGIN